MTQATNNRSFMRRSEDLPVLAVSQDYELFFHRSGSIEKCLFEPCDLLVDYAADRDMRITFFVDAGMLCRMEELASSAPELDRDLSRVRQHIETLYSKGHEIGLHIHPHWEETRWYNGAWDFSNTRYRLDEFSDDEIADIVMRHTKVLNELCDGNVRCYRAGGFCVEPFFRLRQALSDVGITVDSSVVPGLVLKDDSKGFDFSNAPDAAWWYFDESPLNPVKNGQFLEIPITSNSLPFYHYWGRALDRVLKRQPATVLGDGLSKAIGRREIVRRLTAGGSLSELSMDAPKAARLTSAGVQRQSRKVWHVMGHPKLLGPPSLRYLDAFRAQFNIKRSETLSDLAEAIRLSGKQRG